jgi:hypothetical protein
VKKKNEKATTANGKVSPPLRQTPNSTVVPLVTQVVTQALFSKKCFPVTQHRYMHGTMENDLKRGRPSKPDAERLAELIAFRCTKEERERIEQAAKQAGQSVAVWLRDRTLRAAKSLRKPRQRG